VEPLSNDSLSILLSGEFQNSLNSSSGLEDPSKQIHSHVFSLQGAKQLLSELEMKIDDLEKKLSEEIGRSSPSSVFPDRNS